MSRVLTDVLVENGIRGILGVPMHLAGTPVGSLNCINRGLRRWDKSDRSGLLAFNRIASGSWPMPFWRPAAKHF